jgi:NAD(P)-dependent dehydrogenase (short-subunit alcohol dehydrogenase family)
MQVAFISGSAKGIGRALAIDLAQHGYTVVVHYHHSHATATATLAEVQSYSPASRLMQADLTQFGEVQRLFAAIQREFGRLDVLINAVGNFGIYHPITAVTPDELDDVLNSNIRATLLCMQQAVPLLQAAGSGRIVNFGCATADQTIARKYTVPYYIAKSGVITLTKSYAELLAQYHITVNTVSPGVVENSIVTQALPMGRPAQYADITAAVRWLISAEASYVSGANLEVAGGWVPHHSL